MAAQCNLPNWNHISQCGMAAKGCATTVAAVIVAVVAGRGRDQAKRATAKVDSSGCHVNSGCGGGRSRRGRPTRQHPCLSGTLSPMAARPPCRRQQWPCPPRCPLAAATAATAAGAAAASPERAEHFGGIQLACALERSPAMPHLRGALGLAFPIFWGREHRGS